MGRSRLRTPHTFTPSTACSTERTASRDLVDSCTADKQGALALTDHGNMFGAIELYQKCSSKDIKPILGCEVYIAQNSRKLPHSRKTNKYNHLTLLARNQTGYQNLLKLATAAYTEGFHFRPRIDQELLSQYADGISCLSGCLSGRINQFFLEDKEAEAEKLATEYRDLFGAEHFWLELQRNGIQIQDKANEGMVRLAQRTGIPLVATNDIHYLRHEDCAAQDVLLCINTGARRSDEKRFKMDTDTLFFRTRAEMGEIFRDLPEALKATMDVADQVDLKLTFGEYHLPIFTPDTGEEPSDFFDRLCLEGLVERYGADNPKARERLEYEKRVIREMGFESYFLIVWDLIRWARDNGIPVGPGRGSAAGSIVAYVLDIVRVDPLKYDLLFERFLNSARVSMPDIDIDFCKEGRERVLEYTRIKYGSDHVAQIATFGTMASRTVVRDVARVLDIPLGDVDKIAKKVPAGPGAPSLKDAVATNDDLLQIRKEHPEYEELFDLSTTLEGLARHVSTHAAGVVIADAPIDTYVPLCTLTQGGEVSTQWAAGQLEDLGLLKMDYLGLRTLTILDRATRNIRSSAAKRPTSRTCPRATGRRTRCSRAATRLACSSSNPRACASCSRACGPTASKTSSPSWRSTVPARSRRAWTRCSSAASTSSKRSSTPPLLEKILESTYGCIVYQEQVMLISSELAGFSLNEADNLRKAMGKKKPEIMQAFSQQFVDGAGKNGCAPDVAQEIWDNIVKFGGYGFNKSHSTAYALITYQTAFLKANFRTAFLAGNMSCEMQDADKIKAFVDDCRKSEIEVLPPSILRSDWEFEPAGEKTIRFGLGAIKGTGFRAIELILAARAEDPELDTLHKFTAAVDPSEVNKGTWEALTKAGSFDDLGHNRGAVLHALDGALRDGQRAAADRKSGQGSLFDAMGGGEDESADEPEGDGIDDSKAWEVRETLRAEFEVLGFYLSGHPLEERAGLFSMLSTTTTRDLEQLAGGAEVTIAGLILGKRENLTRAGKKMARFVLEDLHGNTPVTVFPRTYEEHKERIVDDTIVVCRAKLEEREDNSGTSVGLLLDEILPMEEALARFEGAMLIRLTPENAEQLPSISDTLKRHPGSQPLYFEVQGDDGYVRRVRANGDMRVAINADLATEMNKLLGTGRVRLARV